MEKMIKIIKRNGAGFALLFLLLFGLKQHYSTGSVESLRWILAPTAKVVSLVTDTPFSYQYGEGFVNLDSKVIIAKACAGINFMIILLMMISIPVLGKLPRKRQQILYLGGAMILSWLLTILVNTLRITLSMELFQLSIYNEIITKALVHRIAGIAVYFSSLLVIYPLVMSVVDRKLLKVPGQVHTNLIPFLSYLTVTLLIPLLNRSGSWEWGFISHQLSVVLIPVTLIFMVKLGRRVI